MKKIASSILRLLGWKCLPTPQEQPKHSIICVAPHTSNLDFIIGKLYYLTQGKPHSFLMKKSWFFFPLGYLLKAIGGIPVNRDKKGDMAITPEGTRSYREEWKSGFYRIALAAGIDIELAVIDYKRKEVGIFEVFTPTGDIDKDIAYIRSRFSKEQAKYPEKYHEHTQEA